MYLIEYSFWVILSIIVYVYIGYPITLFLFSKFLKREVKKGSFEPTVTILIAAYNEEVSIRKTLENKLELDYPKDKLEIIVVSDGSTDRTDHIVGEFSDGPVRLLRQEPRNGKTSALNMAVKEAKGEILVFSDANSLYEKEALLHLMENFNDPAVGYVTGKMIYTNPDGTMIGDGCSAYMRYENFLRHHEAKIGSVVGVDGGVDAVRKALYQPMRADQLPDFVLPLKVVEQGYRVVYESRAILREQALKSSGDEYKMRVRVSLRALWAIRDMKNLLNPYRYGLFSLQFIFHKVLRYTLFVFISLFYFCNLFLLTKGVVYQAIFLTQNLFYLSSYLGYQGDQRGKAHPLFNLPYYFILINLAAGHAFIKFLKGTKQIIWTPRTG